MIYSIHNVYQLGIHDSIGILLRFFNFLALLFSSFFNKLLIRQFQFALADAAYLHLFNLDDNEEISPYCREKCQQRGMKCVDSDYALIKKQ